MERFEKIMGRKLDEGEEGEGNGESKKSDEDVMKPKTESNVVTAPGACMRMIFDAFKRNTEYILKQEEVKFRKVVQVLQEVRDKHERLLRPRLGSPDAADELQELDNKEHERSVEYSDNVTKFRSQLVQTLAEQTGVFCENVGLCSKTLIQYIDTSMRLEAIELPPNTAVPKKRMTLKRLRKAQRIKDAVARGEEDRSTERDWPALDLEPIVRLIKSAEDMVPELSAPSEEAAQPAKGKGAAEPAAKEAKSLMDEGWIEATKESSVAHGAVSTAHRVLVTERDGAMSSYSEMLADRLFEIRATYTGLLDSEASWLARWETQVAMLREGGL
jgi:hypothetical protein